VVLGGLRLLTAACCLSVGVASLLAAPQSSTRERVRVPGAFEKAMEDAIAAYAGGDDSAADRWMSTSVRSRTAADHAEAVLAKPVPWSPARAAFALEVAALHGLRESPLFSIGRDMVMARPTPLGADSAGDRFEIQFHHTAIAALQGNSRVKELVEYVNAVSSRLEEARRRGIVLDTRIPLARAFASAILCCWKPVVGEQIRRFDGISRNTSLDVAMAQFEEAARVPSLRAEALLRGANLLFESGRKSEALEWIERLPDHGDTDLGYVQHWIHARMLDAVERPEAAAEAYRRALIFAPQSQPATIGFAAALLRAGRAEASAKAAADARAMHAAMTPADRAAYEEGAGRPMSTFRRGDHRFFQQWLADLRSIRR
jgi:hypothetical protein